MGQGLAAIERCPVGTDRRGVSGIDSFPADRNAGRRGAQTGQARRGMAIKVLECGNAIRAETRLIRSSKKSRNKLLIYFRLTTAAV